MIYYQIGFILLLLVGVILIVNPFVQVLSRVLIQRQRKRILTQNRKLTENVKIYDFENLPFVNKLKFYMELADLYLSPFIIIGISVFIALIVFIGSQVVMDAILNSLLLAIIFGSSPYLYVWSKLQKKQHAMSLVMIPAVQTFIGFYTELNNLQYAIKMSTDQMPFEIKGEWTKLINDINTSNLEDEANTKTALLRFAERMRNGWADDFVDILITGLETGTNITHSLYRLVTEMQNASFNEEKRIMVLAAYRWGTFLLILLGILIILFNIHLDEQTAYYYFEDPAGRSIVTLSVVVLFLSLFFALYLGRRKF